MRYTDFKIVESTLKNKILLSEASKPIGGGRSNWASTADKASKSDPTKYVKAVAASIANNKTFTYIQDKEERHGIVSSIQVNDPDYSTVYNEDWEAYALANWPEWIETTTFIIDEDEVSPKQLVKTEAVTGTLTPNTGDIAEAVLGAAISAKFEQGGRDITADSVVNILKTVVAGKEFKASTTYNEKGIIEDTISFKLTLNDKSMKGLRLWIEEENPMATPDSFKLVTEFEVKKEKVKELQKLIKDSIVYANTNKRATLAVAQAKDTQGQNDVKIVSDGADSEKQNSTKVDLSIQYDDKPPVRLLSLKAGTVKQFGQVSGGEFETAARFFNSVFKIDLDSQLKNKFGFKDSTDPDYKEFNYGKGPFAKLYAEMAKQVMDYTKGDNTREEYKLVQNLYNAVRYHATLDMEGVTMVILSPSAKVAYKELAFDERLLAALELYDLEVINEPGLSNHRISIIGILKADEARETLGKTATKINSKSVLVQLRTAQNAGAIRNMVEMGPLLKELADIEKLDKAQEEQQKSTEEPTDKVDPKPNDPNTTL